MPRRRLTRGGSQSLEEVLFELAGQNASVTEGAAFLVEVCRDNPVLRVRLEVLLEGHFESADFLTESSKPITFDNRLLNRS